MDDPAWVLYKDKPWDDIAKVAAAMVSILDRNVGEILALLKELGIDEKTIIFFTSDNGADRQFYEALNSCGEMSGHKGTLNEGGIRVPMIVRWPGKIRAGQVNDLPWYFPDVMPTLAQLAGVSAEVPKDIGEKNDLSAQHPDIAKQISDIMAEAWVTPRSQQDDGRYPAPR